MGGRPMMRDNQRFDDRHRDYNDRERMNPDGRHQDFDDGPRQALSGHRGRGRGDGRGVRRGNYNQHGDHDDNEFPDRSRGGPYRDHPRGGFRGERGADRGGMRMRGGDRGGQRMRGGDRGGYEN